MKILTIVGARPQFVKAAVVSRAFDSQDTDVTEVLVHTGQHYDTNMSDIFFEELGIPEAKYNLGVGSDAPSAQLGSMLKEIEPVLREEKPDGVLLYGDTNSTLAGALSATYLNIPVVHVEAGERIYRRHNVPEEINRILTDNISSLCLTSTRRAERYLQREGFAPQRVRFVGDPMYDLFLWAQSKLDSGSEKSLSDFGLEQEEYHLATIHRAENTNNKTLLFNILEAFEKAELPVILPMHPRVKAILQEEEYRASDGLILVDALGYFDFINLLVNCKKVVTDSGGVTREAFFAEKPCIIPMENSWWTEVVESGWARSVSAQKENITKALNHFEPPNEYPEGLFGDGDSGTHIASEITAFLSGRTGESAWHPHGSIGEIPKTEYSELTYANFSAFIAALKSGGYAFTGFDQAVEHLDLEKPFVLMRHDIDVSLEEALELAKREHELGIKATYFFMIRNDLYNIFSDNGSRYVEKILDLGHNLGLHFDCASYPDGYSVAEINRACQHEAGMLEEWFDTPVTAVSFHRPDELVLTGNEELTQPLPHTYQPMFTEDITYFSDSKGKWRYGHPLDSEAFRDKTPLHILIHPVWWNENGVFSYEVLLQLIEDKKSSMETYLAENNTVFRAGNYKKVTDPK